MFIKYVLIPLRMDKKKDIKKHSSKHGARETTRRRFVIFCIIFCVDSIKGDAQKKTEEEKRTRKHLQHQKHQKNCWNWQNCSLCVLWSSNPLYFFKKKNFWNKKRAHEVRVASVPRTSNAMRGRADEGGKVKLLPSSEEVLCKLDEMTPKRG